MHFEVGVWPSGIMCRCGQVHITHGYEFVVDSKQLVWTESQFSEKLALKGKTFLGLHVYKDNNGDDKGCQSARWKDVGCLLTSPNVLLRKLPRLEQARDIEQLCLDSTKPAMRISSMCTDSYHSRFQRKKKTMEFADTHKN